MNEYCCLLLTLSHEIAYFTRYTQKARLPIPGCCGLPMPRTGKTDPAMRAFLLPKEDPMGKKWKFLLVMIVAASLIVIPCGGVLAQDSPNEVDRDAGVMAADLVLARPVGLVAIAAGACLFVASIPFSALGGNTGQAFQKLVIEPTDFTFHRPLGDL
jgi:hypothetical protein